MKKIIKKFNNLIKNTIFKVQNKTNTNFTISNFNKYLITFISLLFLYILIDKKILNYLNNKFFYSFIFIWTVLLLSLFFSHEPQNSMQRALGFIRFIIFVFLIRYFFGLENACLQISIKIRH